MEQVNQHLNKLYKVLRDLNPTRTLRLLCICVLANMAVGCDSNLKVKTRHVDTNDYNSFTLEKIDFLVAKPGETVTITAQNIPTNPKIQVGDQIIDCVRISDTQLQFVFPSAGANGKTSITTSNGSSLSLIANHTNEYPVITADPSLICTGVSFMNQDGAIFQGTKDCNTSLAACSSDGATNCVTSANFKAADMANALPANIKTGITLGGITGAANPSPADCSTDGETNCLTTNSFRATSGVVASNIKNGITIAGVNGSYPSVATKLVGASATTDLTSLAATTPADTYEFFDSTGNRYTGAIADAGIISSSTAAQNFTAAAYRQFTVTGDSNLVANNIANGVDIFGVTGNSALETHSNCVVDGATNCVTTAAYKAADMSNVVAGNIKSGVTLAGVAGQYPSATYPLPLASVTTDLSGLDASVAAGSYEFWDSAGARYTGSITDAGTVTPNTTNQTFNASLYRTFTVAGNANLTPANIKSGVSIFGVTGDYPSATYPLAGADSTADLDLTSFDTKIKNATAFEWFDAAGNRYTYAGDSDIGAANIGNGFTIFGATGTNGTYCNADGQTACITTSQYKAGNPSALSAWDIRKGKTAGGINGLLIFNKNMANTTLFDRSAGTGGVAGLDIYDSIDDQNNGGALPTQNNTGWEQNTGSSWVRDSLSDDGSGGGSASDGICNGSEACVYMDRMTNLYWSKDDGTTRLWEATITYCDGLTYGGYSDWRVPTQKESILANNNGIAVLAAAGTLNIGNVKYWTATTFAGATTLAWDTKYLQGFTEPLAKTSNSFRVLCARP